MSGDQISPEQAWEHFCDRMQALGRTLAGPDFPDGELDRSEGVKHLANQVACWLTYAVGQSNPAVPHFFRHNNLTYQWGGPNVDNNTRRAVIDGRGTYRISGRMHGCREFVLQVKTGSMHTGDPVVHTQITATDLGVGPGDSFEVVLSADEQPGHWFEIDPSSSLVQIRDLYFEWEPVEPAAFVIERLDALGAVGPATSPGGVVEILELATTQIENSILYWNTYQQDGRRRIGANCFDHPAGVAAGVAGVLYSDAYIALDPDQAMIVAVDAAGCPEWDIQLYNRAWYEPLDYVTRTTSSNHVLAEPSSDGLVRFVVAGTDPGVPNWLDNENRAEVLATVRFFGAADTPVIADEVVPLAALAERLPSDTREVTPAERAAERARRQRHVAWRYRD